MRLVTGECCKDVGWCVCVCVAWLSMAGRLAWPGGGKGSCCGVWDAAAGPLPIFSVVASGYHTTLVVTP